MKKRWLQKALGAALSLSLVLAAGCGSAGQESTAAESAAAESTAAESMAAESTAAESTAAESTAAGAEETQYPLTITDDLGTSVTIEAEPERVVSLSPANTETLFALGAGEMVVGRTDYCNYPPEAADVPCLAAMSYTAAEGVLKVQLLTGDGAPLTPLRTIALGAGT